MQQQTAVINTGQVNAGYNSQLGTFGTVQMPYGQPQTRPPNAVTNFQHLHSLYLGVAMILAGILSIIFNIVDLAVSSSDMLSSYSDYRYGGSYYYSSIGFIGHGLWSGIMCIIAGGFGVGASRSKSVGMIRALMVLSIIAASSCLAQMAIGIAGACSAGSDDYECNKVNGYYQQFYGSHGSPKRCDGIRVVIAMEALLAILSLVGGVAAIRESALCCKAACCCNGCCCKNYPSTSTNGVVYYSVPMTVAIQQQQQPHPGAPQVQLMYPGVPQGFQYIHPGQQFVAGPAPPPYNVGSPPKSSPYNYPSMPVQSTAP